MPRPPEESGAPFSAEKYFETQPPPPSLESEVLKVRDFVQRQVRERRKVVLVTVSLWFPLLPTQPLFCICLLSLYKDLLLNEMRCCLRRAGEPQFLWSSMCESAVHIGIAPEHSAATKKLMHHLCILVYDSLITLVLVCPLSRLAIRRMTSWTD